MFRTDHSDRLKAVLVALLLAALSPAGAGGRTAALGPEVLRDAVFTNAAGEPQTLSQLSEGSDAPTLIVRIQAEWCGTCRWQASWTPALREAAPGARIVDAVVAAADNGPPTTETLQEWARYLPAGALATIGTLPSLREISGAFAPLPWIFVIDTATGEVRESLANPSPAEMLTALSRSRRSDAPSSAALHDGRFSPDQWALIQQMRLPERIAPDPSNRVADDPAAAALGESLFFDTRLSPSGRACRSCHSPDLAFTNGKDVASEGVGPGTRNVPTILWSAHASSLLWDGRADSAWSQAVMPFEDPAEMGSSRLFVAHAVRAHYRAEYERIFGALPPLQDPVRFPASGAPGAVSWNTMAEADRVAVSRVLTNVGKSLAAFQRSVAPRPNPLDRYAAGETAAFSDAERDGLQAFMRAGCAQCHHGPRLSDGAYHNLRFPTGRPDRAADAGRRAAHAFQLASEFSATGVFSDSPGTATRPPESAFVLGAFRTPSLRGVAVTMPYGHGGGFGGLRSVIEAHRTGGLPAASPFAVGDAEPWAQGFDATLIPAMQAFLLTLRADLARPVGPERASPQ